MRFPSSQIPEPSGAVHSLTSKSWNRVLNYDMCPFLVDTVIAITDGLQQIMFEVDRTNSNQAVRSPHSRAISAIKAAVLEPTSVSRTRDLSAFLGIRDNKWLMVDDRTIIVLRHLEDSSLPRSATIQPLQAAAEFQTSAFPPPTVSSPEVSALPSPMKAYTGGAPHSDQCTNLTCWKCLTYPTPPLNGNDCFWRFLAVGRRSGISPTSDTGRWAD